MFAKALALLLTIGAAMALMPDRPRVNADRSILDFMMQSRGIGSGNPAQQQYCFGRYLPTLKDIADQYEKDYDQCVLNYESGLKGVDAVFAEYYVDITNTAKATCDALQKCNGNTNYLDAFECYAATGSEQSKVLFSLAGIATEKAAQIRVEYNRIESLADACVNSAETVYWQNTSKTNDELKGCLDGDSVEPIESTWEPPTKATVATVITEMPDITTEDARIFFK